MIPEPVMSNYSLNTTSLLGKDQCWDLSEQNSKNCSIFAMFHISTLTVNYLVNAINKKNTFSVRSETKGKLKKNKLKQHTVPCGQ